MRQCRYCQTSLEGTHHNRRVCESIDCQAKLYIARVESVQKAGKKYRSKTAAPSGRKCRKCGRPVPKHGKYWQLCSEQCRLSEIRNQARVDGDHIYAPIETMFVIADFCGI